MVPFPTGLPGRFQAAWVACQELKVHLPDPQELDDTHFTNAAVRFCTWARSGVLKAAVHAVHAIANRLGQPSIAVKLAESAQELYRLCSPERPTTPVGHIIDRRTFQIRRTIHFIYEEESRYEAAIRACLEQPEVRGRVRALLAITRVDLLEKIAVELEQAATNQAKQAAVSPILGSVEAAPMLVHGGGSSRENGSQNDALRDASPDIPSAERSDSTNQAKSGCSIPSEFRTRPMSLGEAARYMGFTGPTARKNLRSAINAGTVACEVMTRQQFIFDYRKFPEVNHDKVRVTPTRSK
jgi:hypothetical protein